MYVPLEFRLTEPFAGFVFVVTIWLSPSKSSSLVKTLPETDWSTKVLLISAIASVQFIRISVVTVEEQLFASKTVKV